MACRISFSASVRFYRLTYVTPFLFERFRKDDPDESAPLLVAIPHAGAGASPFYSWRVHLPDAMELAAVRLPGRERYLSRPAPDSLNDVIDLIATAIAAWRPSRYAIFGQCSGALIAFEVARELRRRGQILPDRLFLGSQTAPDQPRLATAICDLPDAEFFDALRSSAAIPADVVFGGAFWSLVSKNLRADFRCIAKFNYRPERPLSTPIIALVGSSDSTLSHSAVSGWRSQTDREFKVGIIKGGHILTSSEPSDVLGYLISEWPELERLDDSNVTGY